MPAALLLLLVLLPGLARGEDAVPPADLGTYEALARVETRLALVRALEDYHRALNAQLVRSREPDELALGWLLAADAAAVRAEMLARLLPRARQDRLALVLAWASCRADPALRVCRGWSPIERLLDIDGDNLATLMMAFPEHDAQVLARLRLMVDAPLYADAVHLALRRAGAARAELRPAPALQAACRAAVEAWSRWLEIDPQAEPLQPSEDPCQALEAYDDERIRRAAALLTPDLNGLLAACPHAAAGDRAAACRMLGRRLATQAQNPVERGLGVQLLTRHGLPGADAVLLAELREQDQRWHALLERSRSDPQLRQALARREQTLRMRARMPELATRERLLLEFGAEPDDARLTTASGEEPRPDAAIEIHVVEEDPAAAPVSLGLPIHAAGPVQPATAEAPVEAPPAPEADPRATKDSPEPSAPAAAGADPGSRGTEAEPEQRVDGEPAATAQRPARG